MTTSPARVLKELRPLLGPAIGIALLLLPLALISEEGGNRGFGFNTGMVIAPAIWLAGSALIAARAFSLEYQEKTLAMLLAQPVSRGEIWLTKFTVAGAVLGVLGLFFAWLFPRSAGLLPIVSVVASLLAAGFWSDLARSAIGAFVFNLGAQFAILIAAGMVLSPYWPDPLGDALPTALFFYGGIAAIAGLYRFARLETRFEGTRTVYESAATANMSARIAWPLRAGSRSAVLNLLRREIIFQRVNFLYAGILLFLAVGLELADRFGLAGSLTRQSIDVLRVLPPAFCAIGMGLLVAPAALIEEKQLGTHASSLALPVHPGLQFTLKVLVAGGTFLLLGIALPAVMLSSADLFHPGLWNRFLRDSSYIWFNPMQALMYGATGATLLFVISVRVASMVSRSLLAVLVTVPLGIAGIALFSLVQAFSAPGPYAGRWESTVPVVVALLASIVMLGLLQWRASFRDFRLALRPGQVAGRVLIYCLFLTLPASAVFFCLPAQRYLRDWKLRHVNSRSWPSPPEMSSQVQPGILPPASSAARTSR